MTESAAKGAWFCGIGMVTPVGIGAAQTAAAVRAGTSRYRESPVYNKRLAPMTMALVPEDVLPPLNESIAALPRVTSRQARMARLAGLALTEAMTGITPRGPMPLFLALPEKHPRTPSPASEVLVNYLEMQTGLTFDRAATACFMTGRAAGMEALAAGLDALAQNRAEVVLVGGIDSYLDLHLLGTLDQEDRVLAEGVVDGFCPGEGAAFLVLAAEPAKAGGGSALAYVHPPGLAQENGHRYSDQPYKGEGLALAVAAALDAAKTDPIRSVLSCMNGENYFAKEWGVALMGNRAGIAEPHRFDHPADCFGDPGAGTAPILLALASLGVNRGYLPAPCLVYSCSDMSARGAACITTAAPGGR
jgi:3-oxoacyl-[acyl-carrier-protein] synthase-1